MTTGRAEPDDLLTTTEVAARLRVHPRTVQRWLNSGRLHAIKAGPKVWRIRERDLESFLAGADAHDDVGSR